MAAGGGIFTVQNKTLPGAYINFVSRSRALGTLGERGIVALPWASNWGSEDTVVTVSSEDFQKNALKYFGYEYTDDKLLKIREVFKGASSLKVYRIGGGEKATATIGNRKVTALYGGTRGNDIQVSVKALTDGKLFTVKTFVGGIEVDEQTVNTEETLKDNDFITFTTNGTLTATAGVKLSGGTDKAITGDDYSKFLDKIETEHFTTMLYDGDDPTTKELFDSFTKRLRDDEGYKITTVLHDYPKADYEGVISVKNVIGGDKGALVYWVAGQTAGAEVNESLTNKKYDGELIIESKYKGSDLRQSLEKGEFVLYGNKDGYKVLKDINTFTSISPSKNNDFSANQVIRVLDSIANDTARIFDSYYLGKVQNDAFGRDMFKSELIKYHQTLQGIRAIQNFETEDISISKGTDKGDVVVNETIEPVGAMEKLYMTCIVE